MVSVAANRVLGRIVGFLMAAGLVLQLLALDTAPAAAAVPPVDATVVTDATAGDGASDAPPPTTEPETVEPDEPGPPAATAVTPDKATAGSTVAIKGSGFDTDPAGNTVTLNGRPVEVTEASTTELSVVVPGGASSAAFVVTTALGTTTSPDLTVPPPGYTVDTIDSTSRAELGGDAQAVTVAEAGRASLLLFDARMGQRFAVKVSDVTFGTSSCCSMKVSIRSPSGTSLVSPSYVGRSGTWLDTRTLPADGTYTVVVDPEGSSTGSATVTLYDVPADTTTQIVPGGDAVTVATTGAGQATEAVFQGTGGQRVSLRVSGVTMGTSSCCGARLYVIRPDGATLTNGYIGTSGTWFDTMTLPMDGAYRLRVDPEGDSTGSATLTLHDVPADATADVVVGGASVTITTQTPGQNARPGFDAVAGQRISLQFSSVTFGTSSCCGARVSVRAPSGKTVLSATYIGTSSGWIDVISLPEDGRYELFVDPSDAVTGSATVGVNDVPADATGTVTAGGDPATLVTTAPGQNGRLALQGSAGQRISLTASPVKFGNSSCCSARISVIGPAGERVLPPTYVGTASGYVDALTLPADGEYTLGVDPEGSATGSVTVTVHDVPADPAPKLEPGGDAVTVTTTTPGQNARPTFEGGVGQRVSLKLAQSTFGTSSCCGATVAVLRPDGSTLQSSTYFGTSGRTLDLTLPSQGTYTVVIDPRDAVTGRVTLAMTSGPSAPAVTSSSHPDQQRSYDTGDLEAAWTAPGDGVAGYSVVVDASPSTVPDATVTQTGTTYSTSVEQGTWYLHVRAIDTAGYGGATTHFAFRYDVAGPPAAVITSTSHPSEDDATNVTDMVAEWTAPDDPSGVGGYAVVLDASPTTVPAPYVTQEGTTWSRTLEEGTWYLHVRAVDGAGYWGATATYRVVVDLSGPSAPDVTSSTHPDPSETYTSPAFVASWPAVADPGGIAGYAVVLDKQADTVPGAAVTQTGTSYSTTIGGGVWYLHVRAVDKAGNAGETTHLRVNVDDANGSGPTLVNGHITEDTVWGPQGSPYVIEDALHVKEHASLTLLPGTTVKFKHPDRYGNVVVWGQLLALGTTDQKVTFTSYKDDSVGGDTNGDGGASKPARGDWYHLIFYGSNTFSDTTKRPVSVLDYTDVRYGGYGSGVMLCSAYASVQAAANARLVVSNSTITDAQWSGMQSTRTPAEGSFVGVYNSTFGRSNCGLHASNVDAVGNTFENTFNEYAFFSNHPSKVRFQYNTVHGTALVVGSAPSRAEADVRYNSFLGWVKDWPAANQDLTDYSLNWWGYDLNAVALPACMPSDTARTNNPPIAYTFVEECYNNGTVLAKPTGYFTKVLPALSAPPPGLPASLANANAPSFGALNTRTGALQYSVEDLAIEDAGKLVTATRTYRSDRLRDGELGGGWTTSFEESLSKNGDVSTLSFADGDIPFTSDAAAGYVPSRGVSAGFSTGDGGSTVTTPDQTTYSFNAAGELTGMLLGDKGHKVDIDRSGGKLDKVTGESGRSLTYHRSGERLTSVEDSTGRTVSFAYTDGKVSSATGVDGKSHRYQYDGEGRLVRVTSPMGRTELAAGYDGQGRVSWIEEQGKGRTTVTYSPSARRTFLKRADGAIVEYHYDALGRLVAERIRGGGGKHVVYDGEGRAVVQVEGVPTVPMVRYSASASATWFDDKGNPAISVDAVGRTTQTTFNGAHKPLVTTRPDGTHVRRTYDDDERLATMVDPSGETWRYEHNSRGQLTQQTDPLGRVSTVTYEEDGDRSKVTDHTGAVTTFAYDAAGRQTSTTDAEGGERQLEYTPWSAVKKVTTARGGALTTAYDDDRAVSSTTDPEGAVTRHEYDDDGRLVASVDPTGARTTVEYDALGRPTTVTDARGGTFDREYTVDGLVRQQTQPTGAVVAFEHDPMGRAVRVTDPLGEVTQNTYDRTGNLVRQDMPDGAVHRIALDSLGQVVSYTAPDGGVWKTEYDALGRPTKSLDPLGKATTMTYDAVGRLTSTTDAAGVTRTTTYDESGRRATTSDPLGVLGVVTADALGRIVSQTDGRNAVTRVAYDPNGSPVEWTDPLGGKVKAEYDLVGRLVAQTDEKGRRTTSTLDAAGRLVSRTHPGGAKESFSYDSVGNIVEYVDRTGASWAYTFDAGNNVTSETDPLGNVTDFAYDAAGRLTSTTDPTGVVTRTGYDALGRVTARQDSTGATWSYAYDLAGNQVRNADPAGVTVTTTYDKAGRATRVSGGPSGRVDVAYDAIGRPVTVTDALSRITKAEYDARGRVGALVDALGNRTTYAYDAAGNQTGQTSPGGREQSWDYDLAGRVTAATDAGGSTSRYAYDAAGALSELMLPGGGQFSFAYDAAGLRSSETNPIGKVTRFAYDGEGRTTSVTQPSGEVLRVVYDTAGRMASQADGSTIRTYQWDAGGRLVGASDGTHSLGFAYDSRGLLVNSTDERGETTYEYDSAARLVSERMPDGANAAYGYDSAGRVASVRGSTNLDYRYDAAGQLTGRSAVAPTSRHGSETRTYDKLGRLTGISSGYGAYKTTATYTVDSQVQALTQTASGNAASGTTTFTYDDSGRLTAEAVSRGDVQVGTTTYGWDADGNRTSVMRPGETAVTFAYDAAGRLLSSTDGTTYSYDDDGHVTRISGPDGDTSYGYDARGELTSATVGGERVDYTRDPLGRTASRTVGSDVERFYYSAAASQPSSLVAADGARTDLVRDPSGFLLAAATLGGTTAHVLPTMHGDVGAMFDETSGALLSTTVYDAFGRASKAGSAPVPLGFQSMVTDPLTGLVDMGARQYSAELGRFTAADDVIGSLGSPITLNRYTYGNADPLSFFDPDGHLGLPSWANDALDWAKDKVTGGTKAVAGAVKSGASAVGSALSSGASTVSSAVSRGLSSAASSVASVVSRSTSWLVKTTAPARQAVQQTLSQVGNFTSAVSNGITGGYRSLTGRDLHSDLDWLGMVPGLGMVADGVNVGLHAGKGDWGSAGLSAAGFIPIAGDGLAAVRKADRALGAAGGAGSAVRAATPSSVPSPPRALPAGPSANRLAINAAPQRQAIEAPRARAALPAGPSAHQVSPAVTPPAASGARFVVAPDGQVTDLAARARARGGAGPGRQGAAGVERTIADLEAAGGRVLGREITVVAGGVRTRPDLFVELPCGAQCFLEVKTGPHAGLTSNQAVGFPAIRSGGAVPVGRRAADAGLEPGTPMPPTPVLIVHQPWPLGP